jgi:hypothetical protein
MWSFGGIMMEKQKYVENKIGSACKIHHCGMSTYIQMP